MDELLTSAISKLVEKIPTAEEDLREYEAWALLCDEVAVFFAPKGVEGQV